MRPSTRTGSRTGSKPKTRTEPVAARSGPEQMLEERGLAGAVGANETVDLASGGSKGDAVKRPLTAERSREVVDFDDYVSHRYLSTSSVLGCRWGHGGLALPD